MVQRRQLPPQIKRIELTRRASGRPLVRYQLTVDVGTVDGKRKQLRSATRPKERREKRSTRFAARSPRAPTCIPRSSRWRKRVQTG